MKLQMKKVVMLGLLCAILASSFNGNAVSYAAQKEEYLVMKQSEKGSYDVSTALMTSAEAEQLRSSKGISIVERNGMVTGLEKKDSDKKSQNSYSKVKKLLKDKKIHKKVDDHRTLTEKNPEWNMQQINADTVSQQESVGVATGAAIKVAILDSGVDYNTDTDIYVRKNFIPGQEDVSIIYEDLCGHGTSVAGIIEAKDNEEGVSGVNSNVLLYSAKVLDGECKAPVSRVVEAIYWAIDQDVDIINISFGTTEESVALKKAVEDASNTGILIIAAAGNNGTVEYPAAYEEVMAIGSVDSHGEVSDFSPVGGKIELVAPGEQILSTGDFGGVSVHSGTSMSAPHITGVAAALWQKDPSASASFIRALLDASANLYGNCEEYGYGLVDLDYALEIYDDFKAAYEQDGFSEDFSNDNEETNILAVNDVCNNESSVAVFQEVPYVEGSWSLDRHEAYASSTTGLTSANIQAIKAGATGNDRWIGGMTTYPQWHGYWQKKPDGTQLYESNYMASYIYITKMALVWPNNTTTAPITYANPAKPSWLTSNDYAALSPMVKSSSFAGIAWSSALQVNSTRTYLTVNNSNIRFYLYGTALHSATDVFAHSTYTTGGEYISHTIVIPEADGRADRISYLPSRYDCASYMARLVLAHAANGTSGSISDFYSVAASSSYNHTFYVKNYASNVLNIDSNYYSTHASAFNSININ